MMKNSLSSRQLIVILFLGLACSTLIVATNYWRSILSTSPGTVQLDGNPVGGDFFAFYNAGLILRRDSTRLYDLNLQWEIQKQQFGDASIISSSPLPFVYPPLVAIPFSILSCVEFMTAFVIWASFGTFIYAVALYLLSGTLLKAVSQRLLVVILGLGFAPFTTLSIISGHASFFGVFILAAAFTVLKKERGFLGGLILSLSYYKPPLFLVLVLFAIMQRDWSLIRGFFSGGLLLIGGSVLLIGWPAFMGYLELLPNYRYGAEVNPGIVFVPKQGAGLLAALTTLFAGQFAVARVVFFLIAAIFVVGLLTTLRRENYKTLLFNYQYSLLTSVSLFLSLQMVDYDLSLLIVPLMIIGVTLIKENIFGPIDIIALLFLYSAWSSNNYLYRTYESYYSAGIMLLWICYCYRLTTGKSRSDFRLRA